MKFTTSFKTPDAVDYAVDASLHLLFGLLDLTDEQQEAMDVGDDLFLSEDQKDILEDKRLELKEFTEKWSCGEYIRVEFDTEAGTCTVLER